MSSALRKNFFLNFWKESRKSTGITKKSGKKPLFSMKVSVFAAAPAGGLVEHPLKGADRLFLDARNVGARNPEFVGNLALGQRDVPAEAVAERENLPLPV